jgi:dTDP-4-dehydrorhamnose 3,5-epimerase
MAFQIINSFLDGVLVLQPDIYGDHRGFFLESYRRDHFEKLGIDQDFLQENHSSSMAGVLRGLHFQWDKPMGKLLRITRGSAIICEVDIRIDSPTRGQHCLIHASAENKHIVWVPPGFANGFLTLEDHTEVQYKCTAIYNPSAESGILWNDPALAIPWDQYLQGNSPILSAKDAQAQSLAEWLEKPEAAVFHL